MEEIKKIFPYSFLDIRGLRCIQITLQGKSSLGTLRSKTKEIGCIYLSEYVYEPENNKTIFTLRTMNSIKT
jgi:hypothetical protein